MASMRACCFLLLGLAAASSACGDDTSSAEGCQLVDDGFGPDGTVSIHAEVVTSGLEVPWGIAFLPEGDMLVTERPGRVRIVKASGELGAVVATPAITASAEAGLLGIALHPSFEQNGLFYVYVTVDEGGHDMNRVERYALSTDRTTATFDRVIIDGIAAGQFHDGGRIRFGPDGMLYVGTGDGREPTRSQDVDSLNGKLLRLTPEGEIPDDNPFPGKAAYLYGIRNTQGFDWLPDGRVLLTDHGPSGEYMDWQGHDELDVVKAGDNLGWPTIYSCESRSGIVSPSMTWAEALPPGGATIYRGNGIPEWNGSLIIGSLKAEHLQRVVLDADDPTHVASHEVYLKGKFGRLRDVVMGPDGNLYVTTSNCDGRGTCPADKDEILRITGGA